MSTLPPFHPRHPPLNTPVRTRLTIFALIVLASMLAVTGWASSHVAVWRIPGPVIGHPWFVATLFDTYFGFLTFWLWVVHQESGWPRRLAWLVAILLLGNIAMAVYLLVKLARFPRDGTAGQFLQRRPA